MNQKKTLRADKVGAHNTQYIKNKNRLMKITKVCNLCGGAIDTNIKWPSPQAPVCDHIIPVSLGGHPSSVDNLQIVHNWCNASKGAKLRLKVSKRKDEEKEFSKRNVNRDLPQSMDWSKYRSK